MSRNQRDKYRNLPVSSPGCVHYAFLTASICRQQQRPNLNQAPNSVRNVEINVYELNTYLRELAYPSNA